MVYDTCGNSNDELDDNVLQGEWAALTEDEELLNLLGGNLSFSGFKRTSCRMQHTSCYWIVQMYPQLLLLHYRI